MSIFLLVFFSETNSFVSNSYTGCFKTLLDNQIPSIHMVSGAFFLIHDMIFLALMNFNCNNGHFGEFKTLNPIYSFSRQSTS